MPPHHRRYLCLSTRIKSTLTPFSGGALAEQDHSPAPTGTRKRELSAMTEETPAKQPPTKRPRVSDAVSDSDSDMLGATATEGDTSTTTTSSGETFTSVSSASSPSGVAATFARFEITPATATEGGTSTATTSLGETSFASASSAGSPFAAAAKFARIELTPAAAAGDESATPLSELSQKPSFGSMGSFDAWRSRMFQQLEHALPPKVSIDWNEDASELAVRDRTLLPGRDTIVIGFKKLYSANVRTVQKGPLVLRKGFGPGDTWWGRAAEMRSLVFVHVDEFPERMISALGKRKRR